MPGVAFSKACETCKKRRVKCDELQPCTPCLRLGKGPCPGYRPGPTKFVDEGQRIRRKRTAAIQYASSSSHAEGLPSRIRDSSLAWKPYHPRGVAQSSRFPGRPRLASDPIIPAEWTRRTLFSNVPLGPFRLLGDTGSLRQGFEILMLSHISVVHCGRWRFALDIVPGCDALPRTLRTSKPMPSYVWYLPSRIGHSKVLDCALDLTLTAASYLTMPALDPGASLVLMRKLGVALAALNTVISDPKQCMGVELLAAVSLLSSYEFLKSTNAAAWMNHHKGLYRLFEKRGPGRYNSDFERQLLLAAIGMIFTISLRGNFPCFLEKPEWQAIFINKPPDSIIAEEWTDSWRCLPLMCLIPGLMTSCREIVRISTSQTREKIEALVTSAARLRTSFVNMAERYGWKPGLYAPVQAPRNAAKDDWRLFNDAEDQKAANYTNYLSALVILNRILFTLRPSQVHLEEESRLSALEIRRIHSFQKTEPLLRKLCLVHADRVALTILLTATHWSLDRTDENGNAFDPGIANGGRIIEQWKFDFYDDDLCARSVASSTDLMFHFPAKRRQGPTPDSVEIVHPV